MTTSLVPTLVGLRVPWYSTLSLFSFSTAAGIMITVSIPHCKITRLVCRNLMRLLFSLINSPWCLLLIWLSIINCSFPTGQVFVELASDSKDFASALAKTQLAELKNAKIVPIPQPKPKISLPSDHRQAVVRDNGKSRFLLLREVSFL